MLEHELKNIWQNSAHSENIKLDMTRLLLELNKTMDKLERSIRSRDLREIVASIFGIILFSYLTYIIPFPVTKFGCALAIVWFIYVIYRLKSISPDQEPDVALSFKEQLKGRKTYLKKQQQLLNTVLYWYILPPLIFNIIMIFGVGDVSGYDHWAVELLPDLLREKIMTTVFLVIFFGYIMWMNKQAAKKHYQPVIDQIERMQKQLEEE